MQVAGKSTAEWIKYARKDDCLDAMVPSDLRLLVTKLSEMETAMQTFVDRVDIGEARSTKTYLSLIHI